MERETEIRSVEKTEKEIRTADHNNPRGKGNKQRRKGCSVILEEGMEEAEEQKREQV